LRAEQCLRRARDGDPLAVRAVVENLRPRIAKMAAYYGRRTGEDPDDLLQEAWIGLLEALLQLDPGIGDGQCYLVKCARWRLLDAIKRARVRRCASLDERPERVGCSEGADTASTAEVSEFMSSLTGVQKRALRCLLDGLTFRETGAALGCTSANVAYHVRRIRRRYEEWTADGG